MEYEMMTTIDNFTLQRPDAGDFGHRDVWTI